MNRVSSVAAALAACLGAVTQGVGAAGFALIEHGASGLGNAYAGGAAIAADPTTVFFNPAGMSRLQGKQIAGAVDFVSPDIRFDNGGTTVQAGALRATISPVSGSSADGGQAGVDAWIPSFYYTQAIDERVTLGIAVDAPFGLATEYDQGWVGRYQAVKSKLMAVNVNPSVAVKVADGMSVGAGLSVLYSDVELTRAIDACARIGLPGACDASSKVSGDDVSFGFNLGLLYEPVEGTRVGFAWRTWQNPELEGDGEFSFSPGTPRLLLLGLQASPALGGGGLVDGTGVNAELPLPDTLSLSVYHALTPEWAVMADVTWTEWSVVDSITINFDSGAKSTLDLNYQDAFRYAVGVTYTPGGAWTWRAGIAYDEEPVRSQNTRTARLPGNDRVWLAVGGNYRPRADLSIDFGYAHLFVDDTAIRHTESESNGRVSNTLAGSYDLAVDIVGVQANWHFE